MIYLIQHRVDTTSNQKAVALRDKIASELEEDEDVTVIASSSAQDQDEEVLPQVSGPTASGS